MYIYADRSGEWELHAPGVTTSSVRCHGDFHLFLGQDSAVTRVDYIEHTRRDVHIDGYLSRRVQALDSVAATANSDHYQVVEHIHGREHYQRGFSLC